MLVGLVCAAPARAETTAALAFYSAAAPRPALAFAFGRAPRPVGFELEYAATRGAPDEARRAIGSIQASLLVGTPLRVRRARVYAILGVGAYGETGGGSNSELLSAWHAGAGAAVPVTGPLRVRIEYRFIAIEEADARVASRHPQRLSVGVSLGF